MKIDEYVIKDLLPGGSKEYDGIRTMLLKFEKHYQGTSAALFKAAHDKMVEKGLLIIPIIVCMVFGIIIPFRPGRILPLGTAYWIHVLIAAVCFGIVYLGMLHAHSPLNLKKAQTTKKFFESIRMIECCVCPVERPFVDLKERAGGVLVGLARRVLEAERESKEKRSPGAAERCSIHQGAFSDLHDACYLLGLVSNDHAEFFVKAESELADEEQSRLKA